MRDPITIAREAELNAPSRIESSVLLEHKSKRQMRVLVACEYSGVVREAFTRKGWNAWSCDLLPTEIPCKPGHHVEGDVFEFLNHLPPMASGEPFFDLMIGHPPCTYLCNSGVRWLTPDNAKRWTALVCAANFFLKLWQVPVKHICLENPIMHKHAKQRVEVPYTQIIQPWQFGHGESKATCLWLKNLPKLKPTNIVSGREGKVWKMPPSPDRWKARSRTYTGIAEAMADQWTLALCSNSDSATSR